MPYGGWVEGQRICRESSEMEVSEEVAGVREAPMVGP